MYAKSEFMKGYENDEKIFPIQFINTQFIIKLNDETVNIIHFQKNAQTNSITTNKTIVEHPENNC